PPGSELGRDHPARLLPGRDRRALLALPERAGLVVDARDLGQVDRVQLAAAVPVEREQQEGGREAVADTRLDGDARPELAHERVEPDPLLVAEPARVVARLRVDDLPVLPIAGFEVLEATALFDLLPVHAGHSRQDA